MGLRENVAGSRRRFNAPHKAGGVGTKSGRKWRGESGEGVESGATHLTHFYI